MATRSALRPPWEQHFAPTTGDSSESRASDSSTSFEFLNDTCARLVGEQTSFSLFEKLPLDLRRYIWMLSIPEQRILKVTVAAGELAYNSVDHARGDESNDPHFVPYQRKNHLENIVSGVNYQLRLRSTETNSPLLYVNHEANDMVHRIHRVHIPVTQQHAPSANVPNLRFCPERDTILINVESEEDKVYFAHFVHDALAFDPRKKGILHLAIMGKQSTVNLPIGLPHLHDRAQAALTKTLKCLESVSLVHHTDSRNMISCLQQHSLLHNVPQTEMARFNRAYPLWSSTAAYSTLSVDPRPVSRYLDLVNCGWDPLSRIRAWRMLEAAFHVNPTPPEKIRVFLAMTGSDEALAITTTTGARSFRQQEELSWNGVWRKGGYFDVNWPDVPNPDNDEDLEFSKKHNAIGFWSIPIEAFGPVPDVPDDFYQWEMSRICDFTNFESQIQLGLFELV